jgi:hypothetical protein
MRGEIHDGEEPWKDESSRKNPFLAGASGRLFLRHAREVAAGLFLLFLTSVRGNYIYY